MRHRVICQVALGFEGGDDPDVGWHLGDDLLVHTHCRVEHHSGGPPPRRAGEIGLDPAQLLIGHEIGIAGFEHHPEGVAMVDRQHPDHTAPIGDSRQPALPGWGGHGSTTGSVQAPSSHLPSIQAYSGWKKGGVARSSPVGSPAR